VSCDAALPAGFRKLSRIGEIPREPVLHGPRRSKVRRDSRRTQRAGAAQELRGDLCELSLLEEEQDLHSKHTSCDVTEVRPHPVGRQHYTPKHASRGKHMSCPSASCSGATCVMRASVPPWSCTPACWSSSRAGRGRCGAFGGLSEDVRCKLGSIWQGPHDMSRKAGNLPSAAVQTGVGPDSS